MSTTLLRRSFLALVIVSVALLLLPQATTKRDRLRGMKPDLRRVVEEIQSRRIIYGYLWNTDYIEFRFVGCENITDSSFASTIEEVRRDLELAQQHTHAAIGLNIADSKVTDAGLREIDRLSVIRSIFLPRDITDLAIPYLDQLPQLNRLDISSTHITGAGLGTFANPERIQSLEICGSVTNDGLIHIGRFQNLERLGICIVNDDGLSHLKDLKSLKELSLCSTDVTDTGILHLAGLKQLRVLGLTSSKVTEDGAKKLKTAMPNLTIYLQGGPGRAKTI